MNNFTTHLSEEYLYEHTIRELMDQYEVCFIEANARISIFPIFNKKMNRTLLEQSKLNCQQILQKREAAFVFNVKLPDSFSSYKYFKVNLRYHGKQYSFKCIPNVTRIIYHDEENPSNLPIKLLVTFSF